MQEICTKYAGICIICNHEFYMQNMQEYALLTLLMQAASLSLSSWKASSGLSVNSRLTGPAPRFLCRPGPVPGTKDKRPGRRKQAVTRVRRPAVSLAARRPRRRRRTPIEVFQTEVCNRSVTIADVDAVVIVDCNDEQRRWVPRHCWAWIAWALFCFSFMLES